MERNYYVIIENTKEPKVVRLKKLDHREGYITFNKLDLRNNIPQKLYDYIAKNGLYTTDERGLANNNTRFSLHRLVCCIYKNIKALEIHHILKNGVNVNDITNLLPVEKEIHYALDNLPNGYEKSLKLQKDFKKEISKEAKYTLASNNNVILEVLNLKNKGFTPKIILNKLRNKLKLTSIYKHFKTFFYSEQFIKWLEMYRNNMFSELNENFRKRWDKIISFDNL